jgi:hydroxymethylpyrimidine pyrophosphatase-like HAD family hydrolase
MRPIRAEHARFDLIVSDIDGCLQPESNTPFDLDSLTRIALWNKAAAERGDRPVLTMCSGRPQPFVEAMCKLLHNLTAPCIAENGVWLYDPATNEYEMDPAITAGNRAAVREAAQWLEQEYGPRGVTQQPGKAASVSLYHKDTGVLKRISPEIEREFQARGWPLRVSMTWLYINCDLKHVSKATGMRRLLERAGVEPARAAGIGDTMSDLAIRQSSAWFACPANAAAEIKAHADFVAKGNEARGVVEILGEIEAKSQGRMSIASPKE